MELQDGVRLLTLGFPLIQNRHGFRSTLRRSQFQSAAERRFLKAQPFAPLPAKLCRPANRRRPVLRSIPIAMESLPGPFVNCDLVGRGDVCASTRVLQSAYPRESRRREERPWRSSQR